MLLFIVLAPIVAAALILAGGPARMIAVWTSAFTLIVTLLLFSSFETGRDFQFVSSFSISEALGLSFSLGADGLSLIMLLLTAIVAFCAIWFTGEIAEHQNAFYACLLLIAGGAFGAFASIEHLFFYALNEKAQITTFMLIGILGSGNSI